MALSYTAAHFTIGDLMPKKMFVLLLLLAIAVPLYSQTKPVAGEGTIAEIYYWKAKPGKLDEYSRYIREYAEPIDHAAQRQGAFLSITTYVSQDPNSKWTHMRIFLLKDAEQKKNLLQALDDAKLHVYPNEAERKKKDAYSETLRDLAGHETVKILP
jgi:hypothetical protein